MSEYTALTTKADLALLDDADVVAGYRAGLAGEPEPGSMHSRSYWHGWRNGTVDGGHRDKDAAQAVLAHAYLRVEH